MWTVNFPFDGSLLSASYVKMAAGCNFWFSLVKQFNEHIT